MATQFRHANSPEELAKRTASVGEPRKSQGFRHHNSPEERAKRGELAAPAKGAVQRRVVQTTGEVWPPPGQVNNAPAGPPVVARKPPQLPELAGSDLTSGTMLERVQRLEAFVYALLDDPGQAKVFRADLTNLSAVTESQRTLGNRLRAVEQELEDLSSDEGDDEAPPEAGDDNPNGEPSA